ncbi:MFS transporter [Tropicimonas sp. IMCC34043]|uniref:MFS transporter n=1 Tax=Tropicimonas sp. IMCC34043 TaxID=2248760 RepID=UPI000E27E22B|nr:MFS transporter [Tropicimonas sp. IMCC34043]
MTDLWCQRDDARPDNRESRAVTDPPRRDFASPPWMGAQALLAAAAFVLLLAGTNTTTPLLPVYRDVLGFSSLSITLTFSVYVGALVSVLFLATHPAVLRRAPLMLVVSLGVAILGDLLLATATLRGVLAGRALAGISGGIGTGAAASLVVAAIGARGRALSATGNLAGAILGTAAAELLLQLVGVRAISLSFHLHAAACTLLALPLAGLLLLRRADNRRLIRVDPVATGSLGAILRRRRVAILTGCLAWAVTSTCIVFLPTYFADHQLPVVQAVGIPMLLLSSLLAQLFSGALTRHLPGLSGMVPMALGIVAVLISAGVGSTPSGIAGFMLIGAGAGTAYRISLVLLTLDASPAAQGRLASLFAAITYTVAAAVVLSGGALAQGFGMAAVTTCMLATAGLLAIVAIPVAPRLG